jgi:hypothetical protein
MKRNLFLEKVGFRFIANHRSREIHRVGSLSERCGIERMMHGGYCTRLFAWILRCFFGYDGCYHCNRKYHYR